MKRWEGKIAVVTGSSSGIGASIAKALVQSGVTVVAVSRRDQPLQSRGNNEIDSRGKYYTAVADLADEKQVEEAFKKIRRLIGPISILINNVGIARYTKFRDHKYHLLREVVNVNFTGCYVATVEAVESMLTNKIDGHIININCDLNQSIVNMNLYRATKNAVAGMAKSLKDELRESGSKIKVTNISPGAVQTDLLNACQRDSGVYIDNALKKEYRKSPMLLPDDVADAVIYVLGTPPHIQIHELKIKPVS